ncbi:MAG: hypothetical protein GX270_14610 [Clostridiaceae bacterium]|nr:hypothetical protein [Clostridiaceae bacterium]
MYFETLTQLITFVEGIDINPLEQLMLLVGDESSESVPEVTNYLTQLSHCKFVSLALK